jgi:hypothetical protein
MTTTFLVRGSSWSRVGDAAVVPAQVVRLFPGVRAEWYDERAAEYRLRSIRDGVAVAVTVERAAATATIAAAISSVSFIAECLPVRRRRLDLGALKLFA